MYAISIRKKLKDKLMKIFNWIEKDDNIKERCIYGIDEIILLDLFEDINTNNLATINSFTINYFNTKLSLLLHNNLYLQLKTEGIESNLANLLKFHITQLTSKLQIQNFRSDIFSNSLASSNYFKTN